MCQFCMKHGDGKRWYANARNFAVDLQADLRRRRFLIEFVREFEQTRATTNAALSLLERVPGPIRGAIERGISGAQQIHHFGQPVPFEQCARIFDLATSITRVPCVCRGAMRRGSNAESCCILMTVQPHDDLVAECFRDYQGGPRAEGFEKLTKSQALALLRRAEKRGLAHTVWTFETPFIAAICNCDLPSGCLAMNVQLRSRVKVMWRGEDVARLDPERCAACFECIPRCPFGALRRDGERVALDRAACYGCGTCRSACEHGALRLEPRRETADVAAIW